LPKLRKVSGKECIKALSKIGFSQTRQKGSHVMLVMNIDKGRIGVVVPLHNELKIGTIKAILKKAGISEDEFIRNI